MQNKQTVGYDQTKKMLNTLRKLNESRTSTKILREDDFSPEDKSSENVKDDITVINDVDVKLVSSDEMDMELTEDQKTSISGMIDSFKQQVSNLVDFEPGITINTDQIRMDGTLSDFDINFVLISGEDHGVYVNADMLKLDNEVTEMLNKLVKFNEIFSDAMNNLITQRKNN
jgi:hypothetical protein